MFDEEFCPYNENSLDILLKFTSQDEQEEISPSTSNYSQYFKEHPKAEDILSFPN
jgi:hypothetical protein